MLPTIFSEPLNGTIPFIGESIFSDLDRILTSPVQRTQQAPLGINLYERTDSYTMYVNLPGVSKENTEVTAEGKIVTIQVKPSDSPQVESKDRALIKECVTVSGMRKVTLPDDADVDSIEAVQKDGVLALTIKKRPEALPKRIKIR